MPSYSTTATLTALVLSASLLIPATLANTSLAYSGRFFCGSNDSGANQTVCDVLPDLIKSQCVPDPIHGSYFCGYVGAACGNAQCDYGVCDPDTFICTGGVGQYCLAGVEKIPTDDLCLGNVACTGPNGEGGDGFCGGIGASCGYGGNFAPLASGNNNVCWDGYCDPLTLMCAHLPPGQGQSVNTPSDDKSERASNTHSKRGSLCATHLTACSSSATSYACVDVTTSVEQCGGCDFSTGGRDCRSIPNTAAVGCVSGRCEIWECGKGYKYDLKTDRCL